MKRQRMSFAPLFLVLLTATALLALEGPKHILSHAAAAAAAATEAPLAPVTNPISKAQSHNRQVRRNIDVPRRARSIFDSNHPNQDTSTTNSESIPSQYIINGSETSPTRYPYLVSLQRVYQQTAAWKDVTFVFFEHICGGTLVAPDIVLTAAHCVDCLTDDSCYSRIAVGRHDLGNQDEARYVQDVQYDNEIQNQEQKQEQELGEGMVFDRDEVVELLHPNYRPNQDDRGVDYDYAIVKLPHRVHVSSATGADMQYVQLNGDINIPDNANDELVVLGWGSTDIPDGDSYYRSPTLLESTVNYIPDDMCQKVEGTFQNIDYIYQDLLTESMMCAADLDRPVSGACTGDSGGPLILRGETAEQDVQMGIVSYGVCGSDLPSVYARISHEYDWITKQICQNSAYPPSGYCAPTSRPTTIEQGARNHYDTISKYLPLPEQEPSAAASTRSEDEPPASTSIPLMSSMARSPGTDAATNRSPTATPSTRKETPRPSPRPTSSPTFPPTNQVTGRPTAHPTFVILTTETPTGRPTSIPTQVWQLFTANTVFNHVGDASTDDVIAEEEEEGAPPVVRLGRKESPFARSEIDEVLELEDEDEEAFQLGSSGEYTFFGRINNVLMESSSAGSHLSVCTATGTWFASILGIWMANQLLFM